VNIYFNIFFLSIPSSSKWSLFLRFSPLIPCMQLSSAPYVPEILPYDIQKYIPLLKTDCHLMLYSAKQLNPIHTFILFIALITILILTSHLCLCLVSDFFVSNCLTQESEMALKLGRPLFRDCNIHLTCETVRFYLRFQSLDSTTSTITRLRAGLPRNRRQIPGRDQQFLRNIQPDSCVD
jgi:hypothetical protein